ncbi:hypothetical protein SMY46_002107 [Cronobacter turicensis]|uniref:hypothetical protein n=1 Tax=Cronobacter turicensis TaxID=413502 RepID=UPI0011ABF94F|nr:hypothetical protein [Cronobacter turicensis]EKY3120103.1 hypothetical protein [Cronobacter turicensis]ELU8455678.1 hypothetical protein [Cronobacter turicensis]ELY4110430.1 hypothetical protein [Cronobacter turicensis]ELY4214569.1 hypothetical protein [Cronobacter turicensis]EMA1792408.1 hypothetical protein [Cronobacter turicensis]
MSLRVTTQKIDTWKKRIQRDGLKGSTYFCQQGKAVWVSASGDHQAICQQILGKDSGTSSLESYLRWDNVSAVALVDLLYAIETA